MPDNNRYKIEKTALPQDTRQVLGIEEPNNFALLFNRMAHFVEGDNLQKPWKIDREIKAHFFHKSKKQGEEHHLDLTKKWKVSPDQKTHYKQFLQTYLDSASSLFGCQPFILKSDWRIALGMGNESVYENGFTFHPTLGIPYLPGSSLKGMTRHWAKSENLHRSNADDYLKIFGHENETSVESQDFSQGQIVFFDALPTDLNQGMVQPDIMNNHYPDYYEGKKYPADWLSPRPIFFLTMREVSFQFCLGYISRTDTNGEVALLEKAQTWLQSALEESGVGAKTAVGYGRMRAADAAYAPPDLKSIKQEPQFKAGKSDKKLKNGDEFQAIITQQGRPCRATVYGYSPNKYHNVQTNGNVAELMPGTILNVIIQADKTGTKITSASRGGIISQPNNL